jgi:hypothetical protein
MHFREFLDLHIDRTDEVGIAARACAYEIVDAHRSEKSVLRELRVSASFDWAPVGFRKLATLWKTHKQRLTRSSF